ncbi:MAG: HPr family phosphocarrier protein [Simkaniaceae bacterium]|nr:HPr family phosphocarrier protein [Simkaniaceae bacterium]
MKLSENLQIKNALGLHIRPASILAKLVMESNSSVHFTHKKETVDARSMMSILVLAAAKDAWITVTIEGGDAEDTMLKLKSVFASQLDKEKS